MPAAQSSGCGMSWVSLIPHRSATAWRRVFRLPAGCILFRRLRDWVRPYWDMYARGTMVGLTRGTTRAHLARAVLDSIAFQVTDLVRVMNQDAPCPLTVRGWMAARPSVIS